MKTIQIYNSRQNWVEDVERVVKTDAEWRQLLTPEQFQALPGAGRYIKRDDQPREQRRREQKGIGRRPPRPKQRNEDPAGKTQGGGAGRGAPHGPK